LAAQANYVEYKKILGLIEQSGQSLIWHPDGTTTLEKIKNPNYDTTSDRDHLTEQMKVDSIRYQR
jgi:hypothetical protein